MGNIKKMFVRGTGQIIRAKKREGGAGLDLHRAAFTRSISDSRPSSSSWNEFEGWVIIRNKERR